MSPVGQSENFIIKGLHSEFYGIHAVSLQVVQYLPVYIVRSCGQVDLVYKALLLVFIRDFQEGRLLLYFKTCKAASVESCFNGIAVSLMTACIRTGRPERGQPCVYYFASIFRRDKIRPRCYLPLIAEYTVMRTASVRYEDRYYCVFFHL